MPTYRALPRSGIIIAALAATLFAVGAHAQSKPQDPGSGAIAGASQSDVPTDSLSEVVVTGTSIRGVAPVGSNVMTVDRAEIDQTGAQTVQQILRTLPALTGMGATPQGGNPGNDYYMPAIHGIGSSSSSATLVLVDGHRISPGSQQQTLTDPNIIPPIMLERVEVLAEGASSTYGSDAVAGVVNFITRKSFEGILVTGQGGIGDQYHNADAGFLWGTKWEGSSLMFGYNYSYRSDLAYSARSSLDRNHTAEGGTNFDTFFCAPASIQPAGSKTIYPSPTATTALVNSAATSPCDNVLAGDILPTEIRQNAMLKFTKDITDKLDIGFDAVVSHVTNNTPTAVGTVTATVFETGPQANPFYVNPPGVTATSQTIRLNADQLLGNGTANAFNNQQDYYASVTANYQLPGDFRLSALSLFGGEQSYVGNDGELCVSCAYLALNGTTNGAGSLTTSAIPGTNTIITNLPLTAANALDVWNPAGPTNRTSAAVLGQLTNNVTNSRWYYSIAQQRLGIDGTVFQLPGGPVKLAAGIEYVHYGLIMDKTYPNNAGPSSLESQTFNLDLDRNVNSAYGEILIPVIGENNQLPFVRKVDISASGRYDNYMGLATTKNPHFAVDWESFPGVTLKANYSTSFVAPQLTSVGNVAEGGLTSFSGVSSSNTTLQVPISSFPLAASVPGVTCNATTCTVGSSVNGISVNGGPAHPRPGTGQSWSVGLDFEPSFVPHFTADVTLFNTYLLNQISGSSASNVINSRALNNNLIFCPAGCTPAQIGILVPAGWPQQSALPSTAYYVLSVRQQNLLNLYTQGIDADVHYALPTANAGNFRVGLDVTDFLRFDQSIAGGRTFSVLNTTGFNNTFPSLETQGRADFGWDFAQLSADVFFNYVGAYRNWSSTSVAPIISMNGVPVGGGDHVASTDLFDLHLAYNFTEKFADTQIFLDMTNVFNRDPVFYNGSTGYDQYTGNIIGRVTTLGFRVKL